jgi:hypothetical protein
MYSVREFKEVISSGNFSLMWTNGFVLPGFMVGFMVLTTLYFVIKHKKATQMSTTQFKNNNKYKQNQFFYGSWFCLYGLNRMCKITAILLNAVFHLVPVKSKKDVGNRQDVNVSLGESTKR